MCRPGFVDEEFLRGGAYSRPREQEVAVLTSPEVREAVRANGIRLVTFRDTL